MAEKCSNCGEGPVISGGLCIDCFADYWGELIDGENGKPMASPKILLKKAKTE